MQRSIYKAESVATLYIYYLLTLKLSKMKKKMIIIGTLFLFAVAFLFNLENKRVRENKSFLSQSIDLNIAYCEEEATYGAVYCLPSSGNYCPTCRGFIEHQRPGISVLVRCNYDVIGNETR